LEVLGIVSVQLLLHQRFLENKGMIKWNL